MPESSPSTLVNSRADSHIGSSVSAHSSPLHQSVLGETSSYTPNKISLALGISPVAKPQGSSSADKRPLQERGGPSHVAPKHSQEPESSWAISSLSGMSWMAALIFSRIVSTRLCHFRLQCLLSTSQSM